MWKVVLLLGLATLASAKIATIGPCTANVEAEKIDFDKFSSANGGVWYFSKVTQTPNNSRFKSLKSVSTKTETPGVHDLIIYYKDKQGKKGIFANETEYADKNSPVIIAKGKDFDYTLKISFLKYTSHYAYYYICSDDGGDTDNDYRYVVSTKKLTNAESSKIEALDKSFNFKGNLVNI